MMITLPRPEILVDGLSLPECPRWHDGALYFADITAGRVFRLGDDDKPELVYQSQTDYIGGLGFLDNGDLIVTGQKERRLWRIVAGQAQAFGDLSNLCDYVLNDMIIIENKAYVSQPGFDVWGAPIREMPDPTDLLFFRAGSEAAIACSDMASPNGVAVSADGRTLYVAEATAFRVTCLTIDPASGALSDRRVFGVLPEGGLPDGICLDDEGAVWAAVPVALKDGVFGPGPGVIRMVEGGQGTHLVPLEPGRRALACALGGADRKTLFICTVPDFHAPGITAEGQGRIERVSVNFAGAGRP